LLRAARGPGVAADPFELALLLAAAAAAAHMLLPGPAGAPPFEARIETYRIVSIAALAALSFRGGRRCGGAFLLEPAALAVGLVSLFGLAQRLAGRQAFWLGSPLPENAVPFGPFLNRNHFASLAAAGLPLAALPFGSLDRRRKAIGAAGVLVCLLGALVPGSRTGAAALGAAALALLAVRPSPEGRRLAIGAFLAIGAAAAALPGGVLDRVLGAGPGQRLSIWRDSLRLVARAPVLGHGPGSFLDAYPSVQTFPSPFVVSHAESDLVQQLVETGIAGTLPLILAFGLALRRAAKAAGNGEKEAAACFSSLAALAVAALLDTPWRGFGFGAFGAIVLGSAAACGNGRGKA
jgi:O-antigen ligase